LAEFPDLTEEEIRACLAFAADRERKLATLEVRLVVVLRRQCKQGIRGRSPANASCAPDISIF
jgi:hypothetical protein